MKSIAQLIGKTPHSIYEVGPIEVWYMKDAHFRTASMMAFSARDKPEALNWFSAWTETHTLLGCLGNGMNEDLMKTDHFQTVTDQTERYLEDVYMAMQGERWSPEGEARRVIEMSDIGHTSMSMGDMVVVHHLNADGSKVCSVFACTSFGFQFVTAHEAQEKAA